MLGTPHACLVLPMRRSFGSGGDRRVAGGGRTSCSVPVPCLVLTLHAWYSPFDEIPGRCPCLSQLLATGHPRHPGCHPRTRMSHLQSPLCRQPRFCKTCDVARTLGLEGGGMRGSRSRVAVPSMYGEYQACAVQSPWSACLILAANQRQPRSTARSRSRCCYRYPFTVLPSVATAPPHLSHPRRILQCDVLLTQIG